MFGVPKVTGQRGVQVWVPIAEGPTFDDTRAWGEAVAHGGRGGARAGQLGVEVRARKGLARLDFTQNARNKTLVALYSVRPAPGAPVSVPITWDELDDPELRPDRWTIRTVGERLASVGDPFAELDRSAAPRPLSSAPAVGQHAPGRAPTLPAMRGLHRYRQHGQPDGRQRPTGGAPDDGDVRSGRPRTC